MQQAVINQCISILRRQEGSNDDEKKVESLEDYRNTIKLRYEQYSDRKQRKGEEALSFEDFIAVTIIRKTQDFAFKEPTLSFYMMAPARDNNRGGYYITFPSFQKWAPKFQIASTNNVDRIFVGLCKINSTIPDAQITLTEGKISQTNYESFVGRLKEQHELEQVNVPGLKASGPGKMNLSMAERVIYFRPNVTDVTGMPPKVGNVALTDEHLIFQSKIRSSSVTFYKLATLQIEKRTIESFIRRNNAIQLTHEKGANTWEIVGLTGRANEARNRLFHAIEQMTEAHRLAATVEDQRIKKRVIRDAADDVLRQTALQEMSPNSKCPIIHWVRAATPEEKENYINEIREELENLQRTQTANSGTWLSTINLLGDGTSEREVWDDPEVNPNAFQETTEVEDDEEVFDYKIFGRYLQQLKIQFAPAEDLQKLYLCIIQWKNSGLSLGIMLTLLFIAYMDWVHYLPSVLCFLNAILMIAMNKDPERVEQLMQQALILAKYQPPSKNATDDASEESTFGFMRKFREYKHKYDKTTLRLGEIQGRLKDVTQFMGKIRTIYFWRSENKSEIVCMVSLFGGIFLYFAPLRMTFSLFVISTFSRYSPFKRHRGKKKRRRTLVQQFYDSIEPTIPDPDVVDEEKSDGDEPPPPPPPRNGRVDQPPPPSTRPPSKPVHPPIQGRNGTRSPANSDVPQENEAGSRDGQRM